MTSPARASAEEIVKLVTSRVMFARMGDATRDWATVLAERRALAVGDIMPLVCDLCKAERRRLIALAREYGTDSTCALADQVEQEEA